MTTTQNSTLKDSIVWPVDENTTAYRSRIVKYGRFSLVESEVIFKINNEGKSLFDSPENKEVVEKLANILYTEATLPRPADEKVSVWRGRYDISRGFIVDKDRVNHVLFVSNRNLRPIANIICSDYIITGDINALVISNSRLRELSHGLNEYFHSSDTLA